MMDKLVRVIFSFREFKGHCDDDIVDRLSRTYTTTLLLVLATVVTTKQLVGEPISCWCPAFFTDSHRHYANSVCWVTSTYYVPFNKRIPNDDATEWARERVVSFYQWVPFIFLCMLFLSLLPALLWRFLLLRAGVCVTSLVDAAGTCQRASYVEIRERTLRFIVNNVDRFLMTQRDQSHDCCARLRHQAAKYCLFIGGKRHGNYLSVSYLVVKTCYLLVAVLQLFLLNHFLGTDMNMYGLQVLANLLRDREWSESHRFPRVTLCSFEIRHQARVHDYVVQCSLSINLFNEKIFLFLWLWFIFLATTTAFSLAQWLLRTVVWPWQVSFVKKQVRAFGARHQTSTQVRKFTQHYLRRDGVFLVRLIASNVGELVSAEVLTALWDNYGPGKRSVAENATRKRGAPHATVTTDTSRKNLDVV